VAGAVGQRQELSAVLRAAKPWLVPYLGENLMFESDVRAGVHTEVSSRGEGAGVGG
jgi:hypothetical protein